MVMHTMLSHCFLWNKITWTPWILLNFFCIYIYILRVAFNYCLLCHASKLVFDVVPAWVADKYLSLMTAGKWRTIDSPTFHFNIFSRNYTFKYLMVNIVTYLLFWDLVHQLCTKNEWSYQFYIRGKKKGKEEERLLCFQELSLEHQHLKEKREKWPYHWSN